jgi:hypothetical protein
MDCPWIYFHLLLKVGDPQEWAKISYGDVWKVGMVMNWHGG